jgi:hypothetical protein
MADIPRWPVVKSEPDPRATFFPSRPGLMRSAALVFVLGLLLSTAMTSLLLLSITLIMLAV